jgi:hypothetical protein
LTTGACPWLLQWCPQWRELRIPLPAYDAQIVSFTYGDTFPTMRNQDNKPYRGQVNTVKKYPTSLINMDFRRIGMQKEKMNRTVMLKHRVWSDESLDFFI